jgi:predicted transcriptional regulator
MKQPNQRYGNPNEMAFYVQGRPIESIARELRRTERSVRDWLSGRQRVPWWVPELLRLRELEHNLRLQQMGVGRLAPRLHAVDVAPSNLRVLSPRVAHDGQLQLLPPQTVQIRRRA